VYSPGAGASARWLRTSASATRRSARSSGTTVRQLHDGSASTPHGFETPCAGARWRCILPNLSGTGKSGKTGKRSLLERVISDGVSYGETPRAT